MTHFFDNTAGLAAMRGLLFNRNLAIIYGQKFGN